MCFLAASALRIHTIISVIFHEGPQFVELSESLVHLVRDKSRKGSFKNEKPRVLRGFFGFILLCRCSAFNATLSKRQCPE